jgi:DNA-binding beta-propeller fold protein YncE
MRHALLGLCVFVGACAPAERAPGAVAAKDPPVPLAPLASRAPLAAFALPGAATPAPLDYLAYEPGRARVWVPVGNTGSVDVFDTAQRSFAVVGGFKTGQAERDGTVRILGPSSVAIGDGFAYVGNRADQSVCVVDAAQLKLLQCTTLASAPDGVAYVASAKEVWVTTPHEKSIVVLDASNPSILVPKASISLPGDPEGYAADPARGIFYTNLEDANATVAIDLATHRPKEQWPVDCGTKGPRGVAADVDRGFVFVACTDHVTILDTGRHGQAIGRYDTGAGVDNIDWLASRRLLYVAAGRDARLTVTHIDNSGHPATIATETTSPGVRNVVADATGNAYAPDAANARLLVLTGP